MLSRLGFGGIPFLIPLFLQIGLGFTPEISGLLLAPIALGVVVAKPLYLPLLRLYGYKRLLLINTFFVGLSTWAFILIDSSSSVYYIGYLTFSYGFTVAWQYGLMNSLAYADIESDNLSAASSMMGTTQQVAQSLGVAVSALLLRCFAFLFSEQLILTTAVFHATFCAVGLITWFSCSIFMQLKRNDGQQMIM
jgi:MFS family permease